MHKICLSLALLFILAMSPGLALAASNPDPCNDTTTGKRVDQTKVQSCLTQSPIVHDINIIVNFLGALVGVVVVAMIILGGIQYSTAGNNPQALTAAKQRIAHAVIAFVAYMLTFAFLQWLIPGGVFS